MLKLEPGLFLCSISYILDDFLTHYNIFFFNLKSIDLIPME